MTNAELIEHRTNVLQKFNAFQKLIMAHFEKESSAKDKFDIIASSLQNGSPEGIEYNNALENLKNYKQANNIQ